jgi:hypothetical protein
MADFARWVSAAEPALGWAPGTFLAAYQRNHRAANDIALESAPVARLLLAVLQSRGGWSGIAAELLDVLNEQACDEVRRQSTWPKDARSMAGQLKRLAPNLRRAGWEVRFLPRQGHKRPIVIEPVAPGASSSVASSEGGCQLAQSDAKAGSLFVNDDDDANDANAGLWPGSQEQNSPELEQGEL